MQPAIEISNLNKVYKGNFWEAPVNVLRGLDLKVPYGSVYGFVGANGAGKTTTIKILLGLQKADSGYVKLLGADARDSLSLGKIGFLPERPYFPEWMRAGAFLDLARALFPIEASKSLRSNKELFELVGLKNIEHRALRGFSKGMLQRIGIAQVLVSDPVLVILDEPMSGLDPEGRRDTRELISRLHSLGKTVFFSSHILSDIEQVCDHFVFLQEGKAKISGSVAEILAGAGRTTELTFRGISFPADEIKNLNAIQLKSGEMLLRQVPPDRAKALISHAIASGGELVSMHPSQGNLEQLLFPDKSGGDRYSEGSARTR